MNILFIHQGFSTPDVPGPTGSYWKCKELLKSGYKLRILCWKQNQQRLVEKREYEGMKIISLRVRYSNSMNAGRRMLSFLIFMCWSSFYALKTRKIDLVIASSTPLTIGVPALLLKYLRGIPYLFEVRDLWPEVPIQMGAINNSIIIRLSKAFEKWVYLKASHIVAFSPGMMEGVIQTGIPTSKVDVNPNMSKIDVFWNRKANTDLADKLNISMDRFKVVYFGALGRANAIEYILETCILLKDREDIEFLFMGDGYMLETLLKTVEEQNLRNIKYLGFLPQSTVSEIVNLCDVSLVTFSNLPILATNSPNKLFDSLSAGKPIIVNSPGWTKKLVEEHECGIFANPESEEDLANKILKLKGSPELVKKMGENARDLATKKYDKTIVCDDFKRIVGSILNKEVLFNTSS